VENFRYWIDDQIPYIKIRNFHLTTHHKTTTHNRKRMWHRELRTVIEHAAYCPRLLLLTDVIVATREVVPLHSMLHNAAFACLNGKKLSEV
jgi:hypothetical protein